MCGANMSVISYIIKREGNPKYWYMLFQALDENKKELGYQEVEFIPEENKAFLIHLHVNWRHRHNGIAKQLLDETFRVLVEDMKIPIIEIPLYSTDGEKYIKPRMALYRNKYPQITIKDETESDI